MSETISTPSFPLLPPAVDGINVNHCKNPTCANFGVPANLTKWQRRTNTPLAKIPGSAYTFSSIAKSRPGLKCLLCGEGFTIKSNLAIAEERARFTRYLLPPTAPCCPNPRCANHTVPVGAVGAYYRFGKTRGGTPRWRCRVCAITFASGGRALKRQRITHFNRTILMALTGKMPLRRILRMTGISAITLYRKIDFLHRQCLAYAANQERALHDRPIRRLYLGVDRQEYMVNWSRDTDRRNIVLRAVGSADNVTGYVFGSHLNFEPALSPEEVEADAAKLRDPELPYPHRRYARLWLAVDYEEALKEAAKERARTMRRSRRRPPSDPLNDAIEDAYEAAAEREDSEVSEWKETHHKLPETKGVQVHEEYALYGHFFFLRQLLPLVDKIRFFLDQDSGMRAACLAAFAQDITLRRADAFYVRMAKGMTVDRKRGLITRAKAVFKRFHDAHPDLTPDQVKLELMKLEIARAVAIGKWNDRWCGHPVPNLSEPNKAMCWLTDLGDYDADHAARLFLKASLHSIDNFFQRVRRSLNPLERPIPYREQSQSHLARLQPVQSGAGGKAAGDLPGDAQLCGNRQGQADPGDAAGAGEWRGVGGADFVF